MAKKINLKIFIKIPATAGQKRQFIRLVKDVFRALPRAVKKNLPLELAIIFISSGISQKFNSCYRKKRKPANVLSFIYDGYAEIFITPAVVKKEAEKNKENYLFYLVKMIVHGMIHASGADHELSKSAESAFEALEQKTLKRLH